MGFPESLKRLQAVGAERYYADMVRASETYYGKGSPYHEEMRLERAGVPAAAFDEGQLVQALEDIQKGKIDYPEFLRRTFRGGCVSYAVYIKGRKTVYFGNQGESRTEEFPRALLHYLNG